MDIKTEITAVVARYLRYLADEIEETESRADGTQQARLKQKTQSSWNGQLSVGERLLARREKQRLYAAARRANPVLRAQERATERERRQLAKLELEGK